MRCDFFLVTQKGNNFSNLCIINNNNCHGSDVVNKINDKETKSSFIFLYKGFYSAIEIKHK